MTPYDQVPGTMGYSLGNWLVFPRLFSPKAQLLPLPLFLSSSSLNPFSLLPIPAVPLKRHSASLLAEPVSPLLYPALLLVPFPFLPLCSCPPLCLPRYQRLISLWLCSFLLQLIVPPQTSVFQLQISSSYFYRDVPKLYLQLRPPELLKSWLPESLSSQAEITTMNAAGGNESREWRDGPSTWTGNAKIQKGRC